MKLPELRKKVNESTNPEVFNNLKITLNFNHLDIIHELTGISSIYSFFDRQVNGWKNLNGNIPNEFQESITYFNNSKSFITDFVNRFVEETKKNIENYWSNNSHKLSINNKIFTYNCSETQFLFHVRKHFSSSFSPAYRFIIGNPDINNNNRDYFIGNLLAYEFILKGKTSIPERRRAERISFSRIKKDFEEYYNKTEAELSSYYKELKKSIDEHSEYISELKSTKEEEFKNWFEKAINNFNTFDKDSKKEISELKSTYEELLRLKAPAEYWKKRSIQLKKDAWKALYWLSGLVLFGCAMLYALLWLTPEGMLLSFIKGNASAIKWSVIYVTFISLLAYGIRAVNKVMFSSFHLARDAEEREQLTYFYLSLKKDSNVDEEDKNLILQSLFSRADTGLLKDDSAPTMPNDMAGKFFKSSN